MGGIGKTTLAKIAYEHLFVASRFDIRGEGFLKPNRAKSLEEVGGDYLKELLERNLLSISKFGGTGDVKYCKIHDLLRDMCLGEAQKENFLHVQVVYMANNTQGINSHFNIVGSGIDGTLIVKLNNVGVLKGTNSKYRMAIHFKSNERYTLQDLFVNEPTSFLRSLICEFELEFTTLVDFRLLRVFGVSHYRYSENIFQLVNSRRYLNFELSSGMLPSSIYMLWNLQTIIAPKSEIAAPVEIWKMPQLKHVIVWRLHLPDPPSVSQMDQQSDVIVLENLQTLSSVFDFNCTEEVLRKIPSVVKLKVIYGEKCDEALLHNSLNNIRRLQKLKSLYCEFPDREYNYLRDILGFPGSLTNLTLYHVCFSWKDITTKIGPLPHLEKLVLRDFYAEEGKWDSVEGHFLQLKYLGIFLSYDLLRWTEYNVHFPFLERLVLGLVDNLKEIPSGIGDIATVRSIELDYCSNSAHDSAKKILKEQQSYGNESIRLLVNRELVIIDSEDEHYE